MFLLAALCHRSQGAEQLPFVYGPYPIPTGGGGGGGWRGLRLGPFSFSFSFSTGGGGFFNFASLQQSKGKGKQQTVWIRNDQNALVNGENVPYTIYESVEIVARPMDRVEYFIWLMDMQAQGTKELIGGFIVGGIAGGLAVPSGGQSLQLLNSVGLGVLAYKGLEDGSAFSGAILATTHDCNTYALKAYDSLKGGEFYSLQGAQTAYDARAIAL